MVTNTVRVYMLNVDQTAISSWTVCHKKGEYTAMQ